MKTYYNKRLKGKDSVPEIGRGTSSMNSKKPLENTNVGPKYGDILRKMKGLLWDKSIRFILKCSLFNIIKLWIIINLFDLSSGFLIEI